MAYLIDSAVSIVLMQWFDVYLCVFIVFFKKGLCVCVCVISRMLTEGQLVLRKHTYLRLRLTLKQHF